MRDGVNLSRVRAYARVGAIVALALTLGHSPAAAEAPSIARTPGEFRSVTVPMRTPQPTTTPEATQPEQDGPNDPIAVATPEQTRPRVKQPQPRAQVEAKATAKPKAAKSTGRSIRGKASWYCSPQKPICHHAYPPGSMVAAACGKLRRAMGGDADRFWRGKTVTVAAGSKQVTVKLVDWCGSATKTIDLYREPMRLLGGSGVLTVKISW